MNNLHVTAGKYLDNTKYTDIVNAYNDLLNYIQSHKNPDDEIIEDREHFHIKVNLGSKNDIVDIPCLPKQLKE